MNTNSIYIGPVLYLSGKSVPRFHNLQAKCGTDGCRFSDTVILKNTDLKFCGSCGAEYIWKLPEAVRPMTFTDFMFDSSNPASRKHIDRLRYPNEAEFLIPNSRSDCRKVALLLHEVDKDGPSFELPLNFNSFEEAGSKLLAFEEHYKELLADLVDYGFSYRLEIRLVLL